MVLLLDRVADINEFAVFEDQEVVFFGDCFEAAGGFGAEVGEDVDVGFEDGDVGAEFYTQELVNWSVQIEREKRTLGKIEELFCSRHIC